MITEKAAEPSVLQARPRKVRYTKSTWVGIGFTLLLFLPTLDQMLNLSAGFKSTEKRILAPFPEFRFPHVRNYIAAFNQYYKENFGWRNALFYQYSHFKFTVLGISPLPDKVVVAENGWFFPGNSMSRTLDQHRGLSPIRPDTLASITRRLSQFQQQFKAMGIKFYILIAPDSYSIYPEKMPKRLAPIPHLANFDRFKTYLSQHTSIPVIDVRPALLAAKKNHLLYYKTDTHWNEYGALLASQFFVNSIRTDFPQLPVARLSDFIVKKDQWNGGDLVTMLALNQEVIDSTVYKIKPVTSLSTQNTETVETNSRELPSQRYVSNSKQFPKLLLIGDSFSFSMRQSLPSYFRETYLVHDDTCNMRLINNEHPDIVVFEIVERNLEMLGQL